MSDKSTEWERRRSRFNHDWLKNRFLVEVGSFENSLSGKGYSVKKALNTLRDVMEQWLEQRKRLGGIIRDFENSMSPATLMDLPPLKNMDDATRRWLKPLIHQLWWKGRGNEIRKDAAEEALMRANKKYELLLVELSATDAEQDIELLERVAREMQTEFQSLAEAIQRLPSKVIV